MSQHARIFAVNLLGERPLLTIFHLTEKLSFRFRFSVCLEIPLCRKVALMKSNTCSVCELALTPFVTNDNIRSAFKQITDSVTTGKSSC